MLEVVRQRAIVEGQIGRQELLEKGTIFEARAHVVVPGNATQLEGERAHLILQGFWTADKYQGFGFAPINHSAYKLGMIPDPEDNQNPLYIMRPRTLILEDQKVFTKQPGGWGPGDPDNELIHDYIEKRLRRGLDFDAVWKSLGKR